MIAKAPRSFFDAMLMDGLNDAFSGQHSGWHTEDLARSHQITREKQDLWAERSQKRFAAAQSAGKFAAEIAPVEIASRKGPVRFDRDEHNRPETTVESLAKLKPAFPARPPLVRAAYGVHALRDHRRRCAAELAGA